MPLPTLSLTALTAAAFLLPSPPGTMTTKYRIDQLLQQEIDATSTGGPKQSMSANLAAFVTITLADTAGGRTMHVVLDSMVTDSGSPIPPAVLDSAKGTSFHGVVSPTGRISNFKAKKPGLAAAQLQGVLAEFYPLTRAGAKVGDGWTDTTETTNDVTGGSVRTRRVTNYTAAATEMRDGTKSLKIDAAFSASLNGTQKTPGGPAKIEGTGSGSGSYYVGTDGRYLGGMTAQTSSLSVSGAFAPAPIPISIKQTTTITPIK